MTKPLWERLHDVEIHDATVRAYLDMRRAMPGPRQGLYPDLNTDALIGLIEVLVGSNEKMRRMVERYHSQMLNPPMVLIERGDIQLLAGEISKGGQQAVVIAKDEWPGIERRMMEVSEDIYFRDFLRSLVRRLTKPFRSWY